MSLQVESFERLGTIEQLSLNADLRIISLSSGASRFADDPSSVLPGADVRLGFPELVGSEEALMEILQGQRVSWSLYGVCRSRQTHEQLYIDISAESSRNSEDGTSSLIITLEDVSYWWERFQAQTQNASDAALMLNSLTASKHYLESILNAMPDMLLVTLPDGTITAVNQQTVRLTEYATPDLLGKPITLLMPDLGLNSKAATASLLAGVEVRCVTRHGEEIPLSVTRAPLCSEEQHPEGVIYVGRDLRERRRAEEYISTLESEKQSLQDVLRESGSFGEIIWSSRSMDKVMQVLNKVAPTETTVLVSGETGTGKEIIARAIHQASPRKEMMFVTVDCASLPEGLIESELFGHEKGAFTGAFQRRIGRFELADRGTIFLDEVGELPLGAQGRLLRVLQEQSFERVGGTQKVTVDTRVIAATNRDLADEVRCGRFREDLFFRLNVFPLKVSPLRERREDIVVLAKHFLKVFARRTNRHITSLSADAQEKLLRYSWPGNVRELANAIERAMIVCEGNRVEARDLAIGSPAVDAGKARGSFDDVARLHILKVLEECNGIVEGASGAAERLGMKPATLRSRMKKLGISRTRGGFETRHQ